MGARQQEGGYILSRESGVIRGDTLIKVIKNGISRIVSESMVFEYESNGFEIAADDAAAFERAEDDSALEEKQKKDQKK